MAEKSDEDIISESGLETSNELSEQELLDSLSLDNDRDDNTSNNASDDSFDNSRNTNNSNNNNNTIENEDRDNETNKSIPIQKKQPKILRILIAISSFLVLVLLVGIILYFIGFFDKEPLPKPVVEEPVEKVEEIIFDDSQINKDRLNKKLTLLTKHEIMNKEELESEENRIKEEERKKKEEKERKLLEKKKKEEALVKAQLAKLEEEKKNLENHQKMIREEQEKFLQMQIQAKEELAQAQMKLLEDINNKTLSSNQNTNNNIKKEIKETYTEEYKDDFANEYEKTFLSFINVATIKGALYKSFLDDIQKHSKDISLCRDSKNRITIYVGPFGSSIEREKVLNSLLKNNFKESYLVDLTNEEYEKRCKY